MFIHISTLQEAKARIQEVGSDPKSIEIMAPKALLKVIKLTNIELQDAIIIKQDMLSLGGEVAVPKSTFSLQNQTASILIMGTITQLRELVQKLKRHYPRIHRIANELSLILQDIE
jgi:dihydropteroate synthase